MNSGDQSDRDDQARPWFRYSRLINIAAMAIVGLISGLGGAFVMSFRLREVSRSVGDVASLPARTSQLEKRLDQITEELKALRNRAAAPPVQGSMSTAAPGSGAADHQVAGPPPGPPAAARTDATFPEFTIADGIALFKSGQYALADDIFRTLRLTTPDDARIWYYSALARGFTTGLWESEPRQFVTRGGELERSGKPITAEIDAALAGLTVAQGKVWLSAHRRLVNQR